MALEGVWLNSAGNHLIASQHLQQLHLTWATILDDVPELSSGLYLGALQEVQLKLSVGLAGEQSLLYPKGYNRHEEIVLTVCSSKVSVHH